MSTPTPAEPGQEAVEPRPGSVAAEPEPDPADEAAAEPAHRSAAEPTDEPPAEPPAEPTDEPPAEPRPRGRTLKIMAAAAALGVLGGAGTGYAVQASRTPTPLPPLAVTQPVYPKTHHAAPVLGAADDDMVRTDGDLTKLLVSVPSGTKPWDTPRGDDGWYDLYDLTSAYTQPAGALTWQLMHGFRRAAVETWMDGRISYEVDLIQYRHDKELSPTDFVNDQEAFATRDTGGTAQSLPHSGEPDAVYVGPKELHYDDGTGYYRGYGFATHGDIAVVIWVYSPNPIAAGPLTTLLQNQLERL